MPDWFTNRECLLAITYLNIAILYASTDNHDKAAFAYKTAIRIAEKAGDFHDQTGNMLSAITSQASLLKLKLNEQKDILPIVDSIITNSNELYDSSKDFFVETEP